ncbi:ubiquinol-cytochrome-c reductase complex assembly factor 6 [Neocloeon triangulifer]|uniref:ubiquinol-cytochrome-c reductase complex assembly factor 6 n=1 Tax=Neocloeon triangulifer TaxID=2078957 RepID=UPI00286F37EE|nr:ubiquinol-cytochrome-c reductase complex assembly factor 6 [Neocloeon triangulifer]
MPAGVTLAQYVRFSAAALLTMFVGSQCVHYYYRPLQDLDKLVQQEVERRKFVVK